jgi:protein O-GlcNAc transferase
VLCFALSEDDGSEYRARVRATCDKFCDLSGVQSDYEAAELINGCGIDILVNLNGYTRGARNEIFAQRPGHVQISY